MKKVRDGKDCIPSGGRRDVLACSEVGDFVANWNTEKGECACVVG